MKTIPVRLNYEFTRLGKVRIENLMAPLTINRSTSGKIEIEADLCLNEKHLDLVFERYFEVKYDEPLAEIELSDIPELDDAWFGGCRSQVRIFIPDNVKIEVGAENMPLSLQGLSGEICAENENGPITVGDCSGNLRFENENGPVRMHKCTGTIVVELENGALAAEDLNGDKLEAETENGAIKVRSSRFTKVKLSSENGMIHYETLPLESADFSLSTENGLINLVLPEDFDFELFAETELGDIKCKLDAEVRNEGGRYRIIQGEGKNKISISTENGLIKIGSDRYMNLNYLRQKLTELKEAIQNSKTLEDRENIQVILEKTVEALEKATSKINEAKIRDNLKAAMDKLRETVRDFDAQETKDKVVEGVEKIGEEISNAVREFLVKVTLIDGKEPQVRHFRLHKEMEAVREYLGKVLDKEFIKPRVDKGLNQQEKQDVAERSRLKILEMLENGKLTAEEAERLLNAIGKE